MIFFLYFLLWLLVLTHINDEKQAHLSCGIKLKMHMTFAPTIESVNLQCADGFYALKENNNESTKLKGPMMKSITFY